MATAYEAVTPFFQRIRRFGDAIVHLGKDPDLVFVTERGFCIPLTAYGFGELEFWRPEHKWNEYLISLLPLIAHVVIGTIQACNDLVSAFAEEITLPPQIAPRYRVFFRGPNNEGLLWMLDVAQGAPAWWSERREWKRARIEKHAYFLWEKRTGATWWDPTGNWLQAERELNGSR